MPIAALLLMVAQHLPTIIDDTEAVCALLSGTHTAVRIAQATGGIVPIRTVQALGLTIPVVG